MGTRAERQLAARASAAAQAAVKAANYAADASAACVSTSPGAHLRQLAAEKQASALQLLSQYEQWCKASPHTRFTEPVVALWEGHCALLDKARHYARMAEQAEGAAAPTPLHAQTHQVTAPA